MFYYRDLDIEVMKKIEIKINDIVWVLVGIEEYIFFVDQDDNGQVQNY